MHCSLLGLSLPLGACLGLGIYMVAGVFSKGASLYKDIMVYFTTQNIKWCLATVILHDVFLTKDLLKVWVEKKYVNQEVWKRHNLVVRALREKAAPEDILAALTHTQSQREISREKLAYACKYVMHLARIGWMLGVAYTYMDAWPLIYTVVFLSIDLATKAASRRVFTKTRDVHLNYRKTTATLLFAHTTTKVDSLMLGYTEYTETFWSTLQYYTFLDSVLKLAESVIFNIYTALCLVHFLNHNPGGAIYFQGALIKMEKLSNAIIKIF
ncbi:hypothetical protein NEDG_02122 [Nematocida displodere]|uniref:Uncharacterized protein n=1 Tax=Nematocida displodere TaxID=1805483 RepID=A0A177ED61_9MICR|nr:hypothetical protein NEDG_01432 [Nematocida displodere]OAG32255.1 hypothetical protein NEDG_02122 [Nematocida displodere]